MGWPHLEVVLREPPVPVLLSSNLTGSSLRQDFLGLCPSSVSWSYLQKKRVLDTEESLT